MYRSELRSGRGGSCPPPARPRTEECCQSVGIDATRVSGRGFGGPNRDLAMLSRCRTQRRDLFESSDRKNGAL